MSRGYTITLTDREYDALKDRIVKLEAALHKYGDHTIACASTKGDPCTCGWTKALLANFAQETASEICDHEDCPDKGKRRRDVDCACNTQETKDVPHGEKCGCQFCIDAGYSTKKTGAKL